MSDIQTYLQQILDAVYGEEVRGSIHDAIAEMNSDLEAAIHDDLNPLAFKGDLGVSGGTSNNLNNLAQTDQRGIWRLLGSRTYTNVPSDFDNSKQAYLIMYAFGESGQTANIIKQEIHYFSDSGANATVSWSRVYISGEWQDWHKNVDNTLSIKGAAADSESVGNGISYIKDKTENLSVLSFSRLTQVSGVTVDEVKAGTFHVTGTATANGVIQFTDDIYVQAGTYTYGNFASSSGNMPAVQLRYSNNGDDAGGIVQTVATANYTFSNPTHVLMRIIVESGKTYNCYIAPMLVKDNVYAPMFVPGEVAYDALARFIAFDSKHFSAIPDDISDLNDLTSPGEYAIGYAKEFTDHDPVGVNNYRFINVEAEKNANGTVYQTLIAYARNYSSLRIYKRMRVNSSIGWYDWGKVFDLADNNNAMQTGGYLANGTDLDTLYEAKFYSILSNRTLVNAPDDYTASSSELIVFPTATGSTGAFTFQLYINWSKNTIHYRAKDANSSVWASWKKQPLGYSELGMLPTNTDLNTLTNQGFYTILSNRVLINAPDNYANCTAMISINPSTSGSAVGQTYQYYYNWNLGTAHMRYRIQGSTDWTEWHLLEHGIANESEIGKILSYEDYRNSSTTENKGATLDLLIYNVAHYNHDRGEPGIRPDLYGLKLNNFKKLLQFVLADVLFISEDARYVDENKSKETTNFLYRPAYPFTIAETESEEDNNIETNVRSKTLLKNTGTYQLTSAGRILRYGTITVNSIDVLLVCAHFATSNASARLRDLQETIAFCKSQNISHYIIAGDLNTSTSDDMTNVSYVCGTEMLEYANGGYLGWVSTHWQDMPLDNLIVSPNIIINRFEVLDNWYNDLYSDHYPIRANVTILDD